MSRKARVPARDPTEANALVPGGGCWHERSAGCRSNEDADAAIRARYADHGPALLRPTTALTSGDRGHAEDLVQETMLRAWTQRGHLDIQDRSPQAWLITVARHLAVDATMPGAPGLPRPGWTRALRSPIAIRSTHAWTKLASASRSRPCPAPSARRSPRSITATGRRPKRRASCRSRSARSDHAFSTGCAGCAARSRLTMRWPKRLRPRHQALDNHGARVPGTPQPPSRGLR